MFVAEKRGIIKVFDSLTDTTPEVFADLRTNVHNYADRGLLGLALDPGSRQALCVCAVHVRPRVGVGGGAADGGLRVSIRTRVRIRWVVRLSVWSAAAVPSDSHREQHDWIEKVLVEDWCQQYSSHSVGALEFGADGALYASGGDGASFNFADYGQVGNRCGDPGGLLGVNLIPPTAEGGALRSQDLRTTGDPASLNGSVIRVDPATGAGLPDNPFAARGSTDPNARRIIAYGMRNPFRMALRPGTSQIWVGDVGWNAL